MADEVVELSELWAGNDTISQAGNNLSNSKIGSKLNVTERTVKFHVSNLLNKFGVRRRADLILLCYQKQKAAP